MNQNQEELVQRIEHRIDRLEEKLDKYLELMHHQEADIKWVKGYIKLSLSLIVTIITGLVSTLINYIIK